MKSTRQIDIYLTKKSNVRMIDVVQFDTGIHLVFTVKDFTIPSGATAKLYVQKPSGKFVFQEDGITIVDNTILIDLENQAITEHGKVPYQVSIVNGSDMITAFTGLMMVEKSLKDSGATESKTVIRAFDEVVSDHVAEFQAKAEQIVQACIATIPEDYTVMEAKVNELANAIKGNASGAVVSVDDVSTVEHNPVVKVRGANIIPFPYYNKGGVVNGITYTANDDGSVTAKGTATANAAFYLTYGLSGIKGTVFLSGCPEGGSISSSGGGYSLRMNKFVNGVEVTGGADVGNGNKIILNGEDIRIYIVVLSGKTVDCTFRPMLNYGESANDFVKSELTAVTVKRCGKNLLNPNGGSSSRNGLTFTNNGDGSFTVKGTATAAASFGLTSLAATPMYLHNGVTYTQSVIVLAGSMNGVAVVPSVEDGDGNVTWNYFSNNQTKTPEKHYKFRGYEVYVENGKTVDLKFNVQLEVGDMATDYESHAEPTIHIPAADGTVSGVKSISPCMTILTDTAGAIVECEYNIDTKKYIDRKISEILKGGMPT